MRFPESLGVLEFGKHFNQSLDNATLPGGLEVMVFGEAFQQSLEYTALPEGSQSITVSI